MAPAQLAELQRRPSVDAVVMAQGRCDPDAAARPYLFELIKVFYNRQRHQAALGHGTLVEFAASSS